MIIFNWLDARWQDYKGSKLFEELCYELVGYEGFTNLQWRGGSGDKGRDIQAEFISDQPGGMTRVEKWWFQCKRYSKHIIAGSMLEEKGDGLPFNTSFVIAPTGEVSTKYQKIHLFPLMDEDKKYSPGSKLCFFSAGDIKVGIIICYDIRFPEEVMVLAEIGIEVLFVPAQWPLIRKKHWLTLLKARAIENQIYVVGANRVGQEGETVFAGNSVIIDPLGEIQELIEDKEGIITCRMDLDKLKSIRKENPFQESKRRDLYQKWAES